MKTAFSRMSQKCVLMGLFVAGAVFTGTAFAAQINDIKVNLPHEVSVGSTTLPAGQYVINGFQMGGEEFFVVRGDHTPAVTLHAERVDADSDKTQLTISKDGDQWHLDKLTVEGEPSAFQFVNGK